MNAPGSKLNDPVPNSLEDIEDEIARWESRQHEGQPGSDWWEQVEVRLRALRHKEQRLLATNQGRFATTINHFGSGSRSYVHSEDHSINFIGSSAENVFSQVREQITALVPETGSREAILARLQDLEDAQPGPSRMERYNQFISAASNHITVLTPILTPFLQWLATHN